MSVLVSADTGPTAARTGPLLLADRPGVTARLDELVARHLPNGSARWGSLVALDATSRAALLADLLSTLQGILDDGLTEFLVAAWSRHGAVTVAARETNGWLSAERAVRLRRHTVRVQQDAELDLQVDDTHLLTLRIRLDVAYVVPPAVLLVRAGRLAEVRVDNPKITAVLSVDGAEVSCRTGRLVLGSPLKVGEGVVALPEPALDTTPS